MSKLSISVQMSIDVQTASRWDTSGLWRTRAKMVILGLAANSFEADNKGHQNMWTCAISTMSTSKLEKSQRQGAFRLSEVLNLICRVSPVTMQFLDVERELPDASRFVDNSGSSRLQHTWETPTGCVSSSLSMSSQELRFETCVRGKRHGNSKGRMHLFDEHFYERFEECSKPLLVGD